MASRPRAMSERMPLLPSWESFTYELEQLEARKVREFLEAEAALQASLQATYERVNDEYYALLKLTLMLKGEYEKDPDEELYRRYRTMEAAANRLQKESKGYLDSLRGTCYEIDLGSQR